MVTLPNEGNNLAEDTFAKLREHTELENLAEAKQLVVPKLLVGTLDSLMSLSDELGKYDSAIETVVRKIERQYSDVVGGKEALADPLKVGPVPPKRFLEEFQWDIAKYPNRRPLPELVQLILGGVGSVEEDLKNLSINLSEKTQQLSALNRKKGGNLAMAPLEEVLTPDVIQGSGVQFLDTDYLRTVVVVINKAAEPEWLNVYQGIGTDIAGYGGPDWTSGGGCGQNDGNFGAEIDRQRETGSPVVPGSATRVVAEGEHVLYTVVILKGQYEAGHIEGDEFKQGNFVDFFDNFKASAREKRFIVREFEYDPSAKTVSTQEQADDLDAQVQQQKGSMVRWCKTHFGEAFSAWVHVKVIRAFVESVLRYGLPPNFVLAVLKLTPNKEKQVMQALDRVMQVDATAFMSDGADEEGAEEYHPYVRLVINQN